MRSSCTKKNIPSPHFKIYDTDDCNSVNVETLPIVAKPALSLIGKSGVSIIRSKNKIRSSKKYAAWFLAFISFIESSFFPIPPDIILIPMIIAKRTKAFMLALQ